MQSPFFICFLWHSLCTVSQRRLCIEWVVLLKCHVVAALTPDIGRLRLAHRMMFGFRWLRFAFADAGGLVWWAQKSFSGDGGNSPFSPSPETKQLKDMWLMNGWLSLAAMFLLCAVKVPEAVSDMLMSEFQHPETVQRLNAVLKFHTLWRFRYQVWPRMEEGAQQIFKVRDPSHVGIKLTNPTQTLLKSLNQVCSVWPKRCFFLCFSDYISKLSSSMNEFLLLKNKI